MRLNFTYTLNCVLTILKPIQRVNIFNKMKDWFKYNQSTFAQQIKPISSWFVNEENELYLQIFIVFKGWIF